MRVDSFIEKVRVGLLKREPYTIYDKKQKAIMEEILKSRQERNRGQVGDEMRYRFRFWCADRKGRGEIVEELVMNVRTLILGMALGADL